MDMDYLPVKKSQIYHYLEIPLFIRNEAGDFTLYKAEGIQIDQKRFFEDSLPQLYFPAELRDDALHELRQILFKKLKDRIKSGDLLSIKSAVCEILNEVFQKPLGDEIAILPETIDIIYNEYSNTSNLLKNIEGLQFGGTTLVEHSANVMVIVLNYCIYNKFHDEVAKKMSLSALLHDIGLTKIPKIIAESNRKLTDTEFNVFKTHPALGHDMIIESKQIDSAIALGIYEHHERLDGSGYPRGITNLAFDGRLIGIIDSFDNLTNTERQHRKKEGSFSALRVIQNDMLKDGKFDKIIFRDLCLSLIGQRKYNDN